MGERVALAGLAGEQRGAGIGPERLRVEGKGRDEDDGRAVGIGAGQGAAGEGKARLRLEHGERATARRAQEGARKAAGLVVRYAQNARFVLLGHDVWLRMSIKRRRPAWRRRPI